MRAALVITVIVLASACSLDRSTAPPPQPQKSALSMCHNGHHGLLHPCETPIFVVDGKRLSDDGRDLNPSEIAIVEIAKGDSAIALYGPDARNGVVVITTWRAWRGPAK